MPGARANVYNDRSALSRVESRRERLRIGLAHKQQVIFLVMLAVGGGLLLASALSGPYVAEGIAFILLGLAGLLMSWTTFDIGAGIKEVVREVGRENREAMDSLAASQKEAQIMIAASMDKISESQDSIAKLLERVVKNTGTGA